MTTSAVIVSVVSIQIFLSYVEITKGMLIVLSVAMPILITPVVSFKILKYQTKLQKMNMMLKDLSQIDELTRIYNRRHFFEHSNINFYLAKENEINFTFLIFDIDFFKKVNDTYGHPAGDSVLKEFASLIKRNIRSDDLFARFGGEEFVVSYQNGTQENTKLFIEKLRRVVKEHEFKIDSNLSIHITISLGCAFVENKLEPTTKHLKDVIQIADEALYKAKHAGRDRVVFEVVK